MKTSIAGINTVTVTHIRHDRKLQEVEEKKGSHLELRDMCSSIVIQMGRAVDEVYNEVLDFGGQANFGAVMVRNAK